MIVTHPTGRLSQNPLVNILAYQFAWFACILSAAKGLPWIGTVTALLVVAWHVSGARIPKTELVLITAAGVIGLSWESLLVPILMLLARRYDGINSLSDKIINNP